MPAPPTRAGLLQRLKGARRLLRRANKACHAHKEPQIQTSGTGVEDGEEVGEGDKGGEIRGVGGLGGLRASVRGRPPVEDVQVLVREWILGQHTQCLRFTLSDEVFCYVTGMDCCQLISQVLALSPSATLQSTSHYQYQHCCCCHRVLADHLSPCCRHHQY